MSYEAVQKARTDVLERTGSIRITQENTKSLIKIENN